jgi:hypothetical protein
MVNGFSGGTVYSNGMGLNIGHLTRPLGLDAWGQAHIKIRPLSNKPNNTFNLFYRDSLLRTLNKIPGHTQIFFDDNLSSSNTGFGGSPRDNDKSKHYAVIDNIYYDDGVMREVISDMRKIAKWQLNKFHQYNNNCQSFVAEAIIRYEKKLKTKSKQTQILIEAEKKKIEKYWKTHFTKRGFKSKKSALGEDSFSTTKVKSPEPKKPTPSK